MTVVKVLLLLVTTVVSIITVAFHSTKWAAAMQQYYMRQSKKLYGENGNWERPWIRTLFKALIVFFGVMFVLAVYVVMFANPSEVGAQ
jgi:ABC-type Fe3+ transport system permease subunit